jgi:acyl-CoA synthetase (AMP-forming)/AMP-acid ligase II
LAYSGANYSEGGENISSVALEAILATHPDILECGIVAIADEKWGECPKAFITIKGESKVDGRDVIQWARDNPSISGFMVPKEVEIVPELPKTSTGKIRKNILRDWAKGKPRGGE